MKRRDLFKFLFGLGLGVAAAETYERLYGIPVLERAFRKEIEYWLSQYLDAKRKTEELSSKLKTKEEEIDVLQKDVSYWRSQYNSMQDEVSELNAKVGELSSKLNEANERIYSLEVELGDWKSKYESTREEVDRLRSIIGSMDELERESVYVISYYREKMSDAIDSLKRTIEKYRVVLGDDRVAFESSTVKLLEDLRLTQEKLQKVLPYFPLILNFAWKPTKVVNDKIYDIKVIFEVISPLSSLEEVEVMLIPVEYRYFIIDYGMREEDYDKVFPEEEVRIVKIRPRNLEREIFSVDFEDLKGGREYIVKARVKDVAGNEKRVAVKTPYIRQFENFGKELYDKGIIVSATYYPLYPTPHTWEGLEPMAVRPLLGKYDVKDPIVQAKHIDWFTGHGGNCFFFAWGSEDLQFQEKTSENINSFLSNPLSNQLLLAIEYEGIPTKLENVREENGIFYLDTSSQWKRVTSDFEFLKRWTKLPNYLKINNQPVVFVGASASLKGNVKDFTIDLKYIGNFFLLSNHAHPWAATSAYTDPPSGGWVEECDRSGNCELIKYANYFDGWTVWAGGWYSPVSSPLDENYPKFLDEGYKVWNRLAAKYSKVFTPSILPGFINLRDPQSHTLPRNKDMFRNELEVAISNAFPQSMKIVKIDTYNEFGEATGIEPTVEEGFSYLLVLKELLLQK